MALASIGSNVYSLRTSCSSCRRAATIARRADFQLIGKLFEVGVQIGKLPIADRRSFAADR